MTGDDDQLVDRLCQLVADEPGDVETLVRNRVGAVAPLSHGPRREQLVTAAVARLSGLDRLDALLRDEAIDEILVNRGGEIWVERHGQLHPSDPVPAASMPVVLERILAPLGRRLDRSHPIVDARLPDGSRVCAVVPPVAVDGLALAIRRFRPNRLGLSDFCPPPVADLIHELVDRRLNVIIAGGTSSGKTSLLGSLLGLLDPAERVVLLEDTAELSAPVEHLVRLEARTAGPDGPRAIELDELLRTALRLRPDRLVVGEVRGPEVLTLIQALNTGHDGSWSTCHANSAIDALARLETLILQAAPSWPLQAIRGQLSRSIDAVIHVTRTSTSTRRVAAVVEVVASDGAPDVRTLATADEVLEDPRRTRNWTDGP